MTKFIENEPLEKLIKAVNASNGDNGVYYDESCVVSFYNINKNQVSVLKYMLDEMKNDYFTDNTREVKIPENYKCDDFKIYFEIEIDNFDCTSIEEIIVEDSTIKILDISHNFSTFDYLEGEPFFVKLKEEQETKSIAMVSVKINVEEPEE